MKISYIVMYIMKIMWWDLTTFLSSRFRDYEEKRWKWKFRIKLHLHRWWEKRLVFSKLILSCFQSVVTLAKMQIVGGRNVAWFEGEIVKLFTSRSHREKEADEVSFLGWKFVADSNFGENSILVATGPGPCQIEWPGCLLPLMKGSEPGGGAL